MDILIVGGSSSNYMPYMFYYKSILDEMDIKYKVIIWDRLNLEKKQDDFIIYNKGRPSFKKNVFQYLNYAKFCRKKVKKYNPKLIIYLGIPIVLFNKLINKFKRPYFIDIRDYHKSIKIINKTKYINNSSLNVVSSHKFLEWLPKNTRYEINHNSNDDLFIPIKASVKKEKTVIGFVGSLRDIDINKRLIYELKNSKNIEFLYHGISDKIGELIDYSIEEKINNVKFTGRYEKENESLLFNGIALSNCFLAEDINSRTLLPNRLYTSVLSRVPLIVNSGNYLSEVVKKYNLGLIIESYDNLENQIMDFFDSFNYKSFKDSCYIFLEDVKKENFETRNLIKTKINKILFRVL